MKTTFCIVGATRGTGLLIAQQLLEGESNVRVVARDPDKASRLLSSRADVHPGDVSDARSIQDAICEVYKAIFFTVTATGGIDGRALFGSKTMIREVTLAARTGSRKNLKGQVGAGGWTVFRN